MIELFILFVSVLYRFYSFSYAHPFWVDEFSTAHQATLIVSRGIGAFADPSIFLEVNKIVPALLVVLSTTFFGVSEGSVRLPFILVGSCIPVLMAVMVRFEHKERSLTLMTGLLGSMSYFLITWSRQARGYVVLLALVLLLFWVYLKLAEDMKHKGMQIIGIKNIKVWTIAITVVLGLFTHPMFTIALIALLIYHLVRFTVNKRFLMVCIGVLVMGLALLVGVLMKAPDGSYVGLYNNVWYYHSFLWREYGLITFLGIAGLIASVVTKKQGSGLFLLYILLHLIFICFFFGPYVSRYTLPIFPFLLIGMASCILYLVRPLVKEKLPQEFRWVGGIVVVFIGIFIIANGHKFVTKPKTFYSVNHDFREIALVDYGQVYDIVRKKGNLSQGKTAVVDTWADRANWYLGEQKYIHLFRWTDSGLMKRTQFVLDEHSIKYVYKRPHMRLISNISDLKRLMDAYPKGFIFIDDDTLPRDVIDYAEENFTKELFLDHYPPDDNPYSKWPATLYSWGLDETGETP